MTTNPHDPDSTTDQNLDTARHLKPPPFIYWIMAGAIWAIVYLRPTINAVILMLHPLPDGQLPWASNTEKALETAAIALVGVAVTCGLLKLSGFSLTGAGILPRRNRREWFWIPAAFLMACGADKIKDKMTDYAQAWFPNHAQTYDSQATGDDALPRLLIDMLIAGPAEEIMLVPGLILLLVAGRCPLWLATTIAVAARAAFHLYYGAPVVAGYIVWALLLVVIWQITGTALGAVAAHALNNLIAALSRTPGTDTSTLHLFDTVSGIAGIFLLLWLIPHAARTFRDLKATSTPGHRRTHLTNCPPITASLSHNPPKEAAA